METTSSRGSVLLRIISSLRDRRLVRSLPAARYYLRNSMQSVPVNLHLLLLHTKVNDNGDGGFNRDAATPRGRKGPLPYRLSRGPAEIASR